LIGHPALILSFVLAARGRRSWAFPLFLVGAIGQVSLLNTFCHLHTPLVASLWRAGHRNRGRYRHRACRLSAA
jgi:hypothetical protein